MKKGILILTALLFTGTLLSFPAAAQKSRTSDYRKYAKIIREKIYSTYRDYCREPGGHLPFPFIVPGGAQYGNVLWDWDSWLSDIAIHQAAADQGGKALKEIADYEKGCVLNFLRYSGIDGWVPVNISMDAGTQKPEDIYKENMHKPCLAQHAAFIVQQNGGDAEWLRDEFFRLEYFVGGYVNRYRHRATGLYFWQTDVMIGVDNDPCTYFRPDRSSGSIFLNCMMYKELRAMEYLAGRLDLQELAAEYARNADDLKAAVQEHCWDERDGFFYSVDLNLRPVSTEKEPYHGGAPRTWDCLIQRIGVWSGFLAMWADIATPEQAERMVREHFSDERTFNAPYGVRTLSKMEKMYSQPLDMARPDLGRVELPDVARTGQIRIQGGGAGAGIENHRPVRAGLRTHGRAARILPALERRTDPQSGLPELEYAGHQHAQLDGRQTGRGGVLIHRTARTAAHRALHTARRASGTPVRKLFPYGTISRSGIAPAGR